MVKLSESAANEVKKIIAAQENDAKDKEGYTGDFFLRVGVKGGGCSGFNYTMDLVDIKGDGDEEFESFGIKVIVDPVSNIYLNGTEVDFKDELMGRGFVFNNPNASGCCGCGQSFSA